MFQIFLNIRNTGIVSLVKTLDKFLLSSVIKVCLLGMEPECNSCQSVSHDPQRSCWEMYRKYRRCMKSSGSTCCSGNCASNWCWRTLHPNTKPKSWEQQWLLCRDTTIKGNILWSSTRLKKGIRRGLSNVTSWIHSKAADFYITLDYSNCYNYDTLYRYLLDDAMEHPEYGIRTSVFRFATYVLSTI